MIALAGDDHGAKSSTLPHQSNHIFKACGLPVPDPTPVSIRESGNRTCGILVTGVGSTGLVTIGQLLGMAAHLDGKGVSVLDMARLAQKGGGLYGNALLLGYAWQQGWVPLSDAALRRAIELNGVSVAAIADREQRKASGPMPVRASR